MVFERDSVVLPRDFYRGESGESSFGTVLDSACDRLRDKYIEFTIRRIGEMDIELQNLEKELDEIIGHS